MREDTFFSIVTPVYNTTDWMLEKCINSVLKQKYSKWELILVDDCSNKPETLATLKKFGKDSRIKIISLPENGGITKATNAGLEQAQGTHIGFLDHDDELPLRALERVAKEIELYPEVDLIYSDEDHIDRNGVHIDPYLKPDWSPERLRSQNYVCHFSVYNAKFLQSLGFLREGFDGSQDHDLVLRASEKAKLIRHIPEILYHWRIHDESVSGGIEGVKEYAYKNAVKAVQEHMDRLELNATVSEVQRPGIRGIYEVKRKAKDNPLVSFIIPSAFTRSIVRGRLLFLLENTLKQLEEHSTYSNVEYIITTNVTPNEDDLITLKNIVGDKLHVVCKPGPFNFSAQVNRGVLASKGELLMMLNDDTEIIDPESIENMAGFFNETDIGAVGCMLYYENDLIAHAGINFCPTGPFNYLSCHKPDTSNYYNSILYSREVLAATFAAVLTSRKAYFEVGGLSEEFPNSFNDIDYCAKLVDQNYRVVWTPQASFYHFESMSRNPSVTHIDVERMFSRWKYFMERDPYTNPGLKIYTGALYP